MPAGQAFALGGLVVDGRAAATAALGWLGLLRRTGGVVVLMRLTSDEKKPAQWRAVKSIKVGFLGRSSEK